VGSPSQPATSLRGQDVQATLAELTAQSIASAVSAFAADEAYICGGGAKNDDLMARLARAVAPVPLATTFDLGIDPQSVEALAFAWLARQRVHQKSGNEPRATGASGPRVLGAWYRSSSRA
jgi:anhydro-N-acetylmuramic acid kinase